MAPITLYHCPPSPPSRSCLMMARLLGLDVTVKKVDLLAYEQMKPEFLKINPQHTVPTIQDNGFIIWDSHAIAAYLADTYAKDDKLYPKDLKKRALVNQRMFFDAGMIFPRLRDVVFPLLYLGETSVPHNKVASLHESLDFLNGFLAATGYVATDHLTIADIILVANVSTLEDIGVDMNRHPKVKSWLQRCSKEIPHYQETNVPGMTDLSKLVKSKLQGSLEK